MNPLDAQIPTADPYAAFAAPPAGAGKATDFLKPLTDGTTDSLLIGQEHLNDPAMLDSLAQLEPFLPTMGLAAIETPAGIVVFDPLKTSPKELLSAAPKPRKSNAGPQEMAPAAPAAHVVSPMPGDAKGVQGQRQVNESRAANLAPVSPVEGKGGFLGAMMKRAF